MSNKFDIIVVGAGHAGVEAAMAAAKMGAKTAMFTIKMESIGRMSCNPTVGGPAKGHLAREIDALGGELAHIADLSGIQFRMLNKKKGPAVWAPRSQNDRTIFSNEMRALCESHEHLHIIESCIDSLLIDKNQIIGVQSQLGETYYAPRVILANGTFLRGTIHVGNVAYEGGRSGEPASNKLSESLLQFGFRLARFKTGTPPRVDLRTVDYNKLSLQPGDEKPSGFSYYRDIKLNNSVHCYLTFTNPQTHEVIRNNLDKSSLYGGFISGVGPRYCPSIEDKIVKFASKEKHQVFIEPEGLHTYEAYVNGISNSLPPHVQNELVHTISGLEKADIIRYAYAIEYDYIIPDQITSTLETKQCKGLYLAGQINGTSGYEEAAAQGLMAGINAVLSLDKKDPILIPRSKAYIGVLIDDLVTKGTNEPYRMFTSRAEYRLFLRQDNADDRLMPLGYKLGLVSDTRWQKYQKVKKTIEREIEFLKQQTSSKHAKLKHPIKLAQVLKRPDVPFEDLQEFGYRPKKDITEEIGTRIALEIKYEGYMKRQLADIDRFSYLENVQIPAVLDFMKVDGVSYEAREKMKKIQPASLGQASRISGVSQSDITNLMIFIRKKKHL